MTLWRGDIGFLFESALTQVALQPTDQLVLAFVQYRCDFTPQSRGSSRIGENIGFLVAATPKRAQRALRSSAGSSTGGHAECLSLRAWVSTT